MKVVRKKVFETNSSSSHSISIAGNDGILESLIPDKDGVLRISSKEFNWEWEKYCDVETKTIYAAMQVYHQPDKLDMLIEVLTEQTGAKKVVFDMSGYIDHNSIGCMSAAFENKKNLKQFLFNRNSYLFTGNDNEGAPINFYWNDNVHPKYTLSLEGTNETMNLEEMPDQVQLGSYLEELFYNTAVYKNSRYDYEKPEWCIYVNKKHGNKILNSFSKLSDNVLIIFKSSDIYSKTANRYYMTLHDLKELKFEIKEFSK